MKVHDYDIPGDLLYTKEHEWIRIEENGVRIGITDYAQKKLHEVVFVEVPSRGDKVQQTGPFSTAESVKAISEIFCPITGHVITGNEDLALSPELVNQEPYGRGWIALLEPRNLEAEKNALMSPEEYADYLSTLQDK